MYAFVCFLYMKVHFKMKAQPEIEYKAICFWSLNKIIYSYNSRNFFSIQTLYNILFYIFRKLMLSFYKYFFFNYIKLTFRWRWYYYNLLMYCVLFNFVKIICVIGVLIFLKRSNLYVVWIQFLRLKWVWVRLAWTVRGRY